MHNGKSKLEKYISYISDQEMDNGKSKLEKYFSYFGPGDGQW